VAPSPIVVMASILGSVHISMDFGGVIGDFAPEVGVLLVVGLSGIVFFGGVTSFFPYNF